MSTAPCTAQPTSSAPRRAPSAAPPPPPGQPALQPPPPTCHRLSRRAAACTSRWYACRSDSAAPSSSSPRADTSMNASGMAGACSRPGPLPAGVSEGGPEPAGTEAGPDPAAPSCPSEACGPGGGCAAAAACSVPGRPGCCACCAAAAGCCDDAPALEGASAGCPPRPLNASATTDASRMLGAPHRSSSGKERRPMESTQGCLTGEVIERAGRSEGKPGGRLMRRLVRVPSCRRTPTSSSDLRGAGARAQVAASNQAAVRRPVLPVVCRHRSNASDCIHGGKQPAGCWAACAWARRLADAGQPQARSNPPFRQAHLSGLMARHKGCATSSSLTCCARLRQREGE